MVSFRTREVVVGAICSPKRALHSLTCAHLLFRDDEGIFNFEGGCYAKTINLTEKTEPDIYRAIAQDALLENVKVKDDSSPDYFDVSITQNGRVSYPIFHIPNYHREQQAGHAKNVVFLSCDAFGVLPPVARLSPEQAMYVSQLTASGL